MKDSSFWLCTVEKKLFNEGSNMSKKNPLLVDSPSTADTAKQAQLTKRLAKLDVRCPSLTPARSH